MAPFLTVRPVHTALPPPDRLQAVIVASGNALDLPPSYRALKLLTVGHATAARARVAGFAAVYSADGDAGSLAALAGSMLHPAAGALLLAAGRGQSTALARALRQRGFAVHRRAVYAASNIGHFPPAATEVLAADLHAALFFSAETARAFARLLPPALRPRLARSIAAAIGPGAAEAVQHLPWRAVRVAVRPTQDEVLALL